MLRHVSVVPALTRVLTDLAKCPDDPDATARGLETLAYLAGSDGGKQEALKLGGLQRVLSSLVEHQGDAAVATAGLNVLIKFTAACAAEEKTIVFEAGALPVAIATLERFEADQDVAERAAGVLVN